MAKYVTVSLFTFLIVLNALAQLKNNPEEIVRRVADNIIKNTSYKYVDGRTGNVYASLNDSLISDKLKFESQYNVWRYENGVAAIGMIELAETLNDKKYSDYILHNFEFSFRNYDLLKKHYTPNDNWIEYQRIFHWRELDDCGANGAALIDAYNMDSSKVYMEYITKAANYISNIQSRLPDGTFCRPVPRKNCVWADDLYMSVPFLARMGKLSGDTKYWDDAILQIENFHKYLWNNNTKLYHHGYWSDENDVSIAHWGRCNGWIMLAKVELLKYLPENHPKRQVIIKLLLDQIKGLAGYQDISGMWHQVIDRYYSYPESSATAMFTYGIAYAVNHKLIHGDYIKIAQYAWDGLASNVNEQGEFGGTCMGTSLHEDMTYYLKRITTQNGLHGLGPILLAGSEMINAEKLKTLYDVDKRY